MTRLLRLLLPFMLAAISARADDEPNAQSILHNARMAQTGRQRTLNGHLRVQETGRIVPFTLVLDGSAIRYDFKDASILLRLGDSGSQFEEATHGEGRPVAPGRYDKPVEGTDVTYEDISLRFLYWPKAKVDGSETVTGLNCWKLHIEPGGAASSYAAVLLWVSKRTGDFLQGEGYDKAGKLVKRFKVVSGQRDPMCGWMLKKMRIETLAGGQDASVTYLEIDK